VSLFGTCHLDTFSRYPNQHFIETGSHEGYGIDIAVNTGFQNVYSIEINPRLYNICKNRFDGNPRVKLFLGDSAVVLPDVIAGIDGRITFWLDAHIATGETGCPILEELEAIKKHPIKDHTILIDDIRLFGTYHFDFIPVSKVIEKILEINPRYQITYEKGHVDRDILVAQVR